MTPSEHRFTTTERGAGNPFLRSMQAVTGRGTWTRAELVLAADVRREWGDDSAGLKSNTVPELVRVGLVEPQDDCPECELVPLTNAQIVDALTDGATDDGALARQLFDGLSRDRRLQRLPRAAHSSEPGLHERLLARVPKSPAALRVALEVLDSPDVRPEPKRLVGEWMLAYVAEGGGVATGPDDSAPVLEWAGRVLDTPGAVAWHVIAVQLLDACRTWCPAVTAVLLGMSDKRGVSPDAVATARQIIARLIGGQ